MLRRRKRSQERRIGRVGRLQRAIGKVAFVAFAMRPLLAVDEHRDIERVSRAQHGVIVFGTLRHVGADKARGGNRPGHARAVVIAVWSPQRRKLIAMPLRRFLRPPTQALSIRLMAYRADLLEYLRAVLGIAGLGGQGK